MSSPHSRSGRITFNGIMRDFDRRLMLQERRTQYQLTASGATLATVATIAEVIDATIWYYVVEDSLVHHGGTTMTYAAWLASLP